MNHTIIIETKEGDYTVRNNISPVVLLNPVVGTVKFLEELIQQNERELDRKKKGDCNHKFVKLLPHQDRDREYYHKRCMRCGHIQRIVDGDKDYNTPSVTSEAT